MAGRPNFNDDFDAHDESEPNDDHTQGEAPNGPDDSLGDCVGNGADDSVGAPDGGSRHYGDAGQSLSDEAANWERGAIGERATAEVLRLLPPSYVVLHNIKIGPRGADIDHLVIGPSGIWVIDSKNWSYPAQVTNGRLRTGRYQHQDSVDRAEACALIAADRLQSPAFAVIAVVGEFVNGPARFVQRVRVIDHQHLAEHIAQAPRTLRDETIALLVKRAVSWRDDPAPHFERIREIRSTAKKAPTSAGSPPPSLTTRTSVPPPPAPPDGVRMSEPPSVSPTSPGERFAKIAAVMVAVLVGLTALASLSNKSAEDEGSISAAATPAGAAIGALDAAGDTAGSVAPLAASDTTTPVSVVAVLDPEGEIGPLSYKFVCSELNHTYWLRMSVSGWSISRIEVAVGINGYERYMGEFSSFQNLEAIPDIAPGTEFSIAASWTTSGNTAPGDLNRTYRAPNAPCP